MKRLASLVLITGLLAGCNVPLLTAGGKPPVGSGVNQPAEPLAGITFKPISAANARLIANNNGGGNAVSMDSARSAAPASAPMAGAAAEGAIAPNSGGVIGKSASAPAPSGTAGGAYSGNVWNNYGYGHYFSPYGYGYGGGQEPMALVSITEAETGGAKGSFQDVIKNVAAPVIKAWAADGRLVSSNAVLGSDGQIFNDPNAQSARKPGLDVYSGGYYGEQAGWRMTYLSPTRNELLNFFVTPQKTLIVRMRWAPLSLSPESVTVDSASAIKKLIAAIEDKTARAEEERTGLDYFLGTPFEQPQTPNGDNTYNKVEVVYDVPDRARWNVSLQSVMGRMVWELNYYSYDEVGYGGGVIAAGTSTAVAVAAPPVATKFALQQVSAARPAIAPMPMPMPMPSGQAGAWRESYFQNNAQGMVDAQTGAVIRFTRPMKHFYRDWNAVEPTFPDKPKPLPEPKPSIQPSTPPEDVVEGDPGTDDPNGSGSSEGSTGTGEANNG